MDRELSGVISFWEAKLQTKYLMDLSTAVLIELTIKYLKELQEVKHGVPGMD
ncbi:MAG: hypothetical protein KKF27_21255 [Gammaproteobacteria bacterium]|nr:hypothetical protein [Gammaproteobacteria bacterium]